MTNEVKNVPELRFPGFEGEWEENKLGDLADIVRGASPRPINDPRWFDNSSEVGWLRISDVTKQNGKIYKLEQKISEEGQKKTRVLKSRHLLLSIAASVGKPVMNYVSTGVHDGFLIFLKPKFNIEFMFQWLDNFQEKWQKYGQPGSQVNLNSELVKSQKMYLTESEEQLRISDFFSKLDRQIDLEEQKLEKLEQQKKGYMQKIFSQQLRFKDEKGNDYPDWEEKQLGDVTNYSTSKRSSNFYDELENKGNYSVYDANKEIFKDDTFDAKEKYISILKDGAGAGRLNLRPGMSSVIGTMGYINVVSVNIEYLYYRMTIINFTKYIIGSTIPHLYYKDYSKEIIEIPDIKEQKKIGYLFKKFERRKILIKEKIDRLKNRKQAFLQKMFI